MKTNMFYISKKKRNTIRVLTVGLLAALAVLAYMHPMGNDRETKELTMEKEISLRNERLGEMPNWDLSDIYLSINDGQINSDLATLKEEIAQLNSQYKGKLDRINGTNFLRAIKKYEEIRRLTNKLSTYAYLKYAENLSLEENTMFYQRITEELTTLLADIVFFTLEVNDLRDSHVESLMKDSPGLRTYRPFLRNVRAFKKHELSETLERLMLDKSVTSRNAWSRFFDENMDNMIFVYEGEEMNSSEILELMSSQDEKIRRKASKIFGDRLGESIRTFAYITNILAKDKAIGDNWRKFPSPISSRNLSNMIDDKTVETMAAVIKNNYAATAHRYYRLKAKMMGKEKLHYSDRNAPLPFRGGKTYSWEEAKHIVMQAYGDFSPEMAEIAQKFFDNNWIDVPTRMGKRSGAFAADTTSDLHPYLLLNYQGRVRDVSTLAHEMGHGIHQYLSQKQGDLMMETPLTLSETASVFGENLVFNYFLKNTKNDQEKISILASKIEDMLNTTVRQIAFLEFEKLIHAERRNGEIPVERINEIWMQAQVDSLGDIFIFDDEYKYYWSYIPHFIHSPFYVYSYAFGDCLVNSLFSLYNKKPAGFQEKYIKMLENGGTKLYDEALEPFGLNPKTEEFWQSGVDVLIQMIDELEGLVEKI